jgi:hypothetical protein
MHSIVLSFMLSIMPTFAALEYLKIEYPGCPENAYCQKNTGEVRRHWLDNLAAFNSNQMSESNFNAYIQKNNGVPVAGWAMEEAGVLPRIMMWDSPCKQHKQEASKFYISDFFRKNLDSNEIKEYTNIYFPRAVLLDKNKKAFSMIVPRGDIPTFIENGFLHYLKEDDGKYYGFHINKNGDIKVTKPEIVKELPKDVVCLKEQIDLFMREAPSPTFYQSYHCMGIWDKNSKTYKPMLFGRSCN